MRRGDAELAAVMRRMLEEDEELIDLSWSPRDHCYILSISATVNVDEHEAQAVQDVWEGADE